MATDKLDLLGPALAKIGEEAVRVVGGPPDGIYLYVEAGDNWIGPSVFKDEGAELRYVDHDERDLDYLLMDAWRLEPEDKRWTIMEYMISDGSFDVKFHFDDLEASDSDDRRERFLDARYGNKRRVYPPLPTEATVLKPPS